MYPDLSISFFIVFFFYVASSTEKPLQFTDNVLLGTSTLNIIPIKFL